jgi:hypothetical protein
MNCQSTKVTRPLSCSLRSRSCGMKLKSGITWMTSDSCVKGNYDCPCNLISPLSCCDSLRSESRQHFARLELQSLRWCQSKLVFCRFSFGVILHELVARSILSSVHVDEGVPICLLFWQLRDLSISCLSKERHRSQAKEFVIEDHLVFVNLSISLFIESWKSRCSPNWTFPRSCLCRRLLYDSRIPSVFTKSLFINKIIQSGVNLQFWSNRI